MCLEVSVGNEILRTVKGSFEDPLEANSFVWKLLKDYTEEEIFVYSCKTGELWRCDKLFKGLLYK